MFAESCLVNSVVNVFAEKLNDVDDEHELIAILCHVCCELIYIYIYFGYSTILICSSVDCP
jgi:hypothetical protein